jgi:hypothetical protein
VRSSWALDGSQIGVDVLDQPGLDLGGETSTPTKRLLAAKVEMNGASASPQVSERNLLLSHSIGT